VFLPTKLKKKEEKEEKEEKGEKERKGNILILISF
jgi:hypothetical protein